MGILEQVEAPSGRPVEFKPDSSLTLQATLQLAEANRQALLAMYVSIALNTPYNDFNNH